MRMEGEVWKPETLQRLAKTVAPPHAQQVEWGKTPSSRFKD
jgi:hypothetical protein